MVTMYHREAFLKFLIEFRATEQIATAIKKPELLIESLSVFIKENMVPLVLGC